MNKGVVMEKGSKHLIILTPDGQFKRISAKGHFCDVGDEIRFPDGINRYRTLMASGVAAAIFLFVFVYAFSGLTGSGIQSPIVAYVSLDINPSIELGINDKRRVVEAHGLNDKGTELLAQTEFLHKPIDELTLALIESADELHYLEPYFERGDGSIVITGTFLDQEVLDKTSLMNELEEDVREIIARTHPENAPAMTVMSMTTPPELREEAQEKQISTGKLAIALLAKENGFEIPEDAIRTQSISDTLNTAFADSDWREQLLAVQPNEQMLLQLMNDTNVTVAVEPAAGQNEPIQLDDKPNQQDLAVQPEPSSDQKTPTGETVEQFNQANDETISGNEDNNTNIGNQESSNNENDENRGQNNNENNSNQDNNKNNENNRNNENNGNNRGNENDVDDDIDAREEENDEDEDEEDENEEDENEEENDDETENNENGNPENVNPNNGNNGNNGNGNNGNGNNGNGNNGNGNPGKGNNGNGNGNGNPGKGNNGNGTNGNGNPGKGNNGNGTNGNGNPDKGNNGNGTNGNGNPGKGNNGNSNNGNGNPGKGNNGNSNGNGNPGNGRGVQMLSEFYNIDLQKDLEQYLQEFLETLSESKNEVLEQKLEEWHIEMEKIKERSQSSRDRDRHFGSDRDRDKREDERKEWLEKWFEQNRNHEK